MNKKTAKNAEFSEKTCTNQEILSELLKIRALIRTSECVVQWHLSGHEAFDMIEILEIAENLCTELSSKL